MIVLIGQADPPTLWGVIFAMKRQISRAELKDTVRALIGSGNATLPAVAARLQTSPRSLQRQLEGWEVTYSELVDEVRHEIAQSLLAATELDIAEVGAALGYRDPSSFSRAFFRWSRMSPRAYRKTRQRRDRDPAVDPTP